MLIEKNRRIARQRRQIGWLLLFILIGIIWIYSLREDVENLKSEISDLKTALSQRDTTIIKLRNQIDSLQTKPVEVPVIVEVKKPKKTIKKDTITTLIDTDKVIKRLDTNLFQKKDSL